MVDLYPFTQALYAYYDIPISSWDFNSRFQKRNSLKIVLNCQNICILLTNAVPQTWHVHYFEKAKQKTHQNRPPP